VVTAIQLESGLLRSGVIRLGAIVASDVDPDAGSHETAAFRPAGGAMLLGWDDGIAGFTDFHMETFPEYADLYTSGLVWQERRGIRFPRQGGRAASASHRRETLLPGPSGRLRRGGDPQLPA
jgi:hypothetical protein